MASRFRKLHWKLASEDAALVASLGRLHNASRGGQGIDPGSQMYDLYYSSV